MINDIRLFRTIFPVILLLVIRVEWFPQVVSGRVLVVALNRPDARFSTISEAVKKAKPHDTILVYWEKNCSFFLEHLVIDKPIRIISHPAASDIEDFHYFPTILASGYPEIVHISSPGVEMIGFNIVGPGKQMSPDDRSYKKHTGIRLDYPALIRLCSITGCGTAILAHYRQLDNVQGSRIEQCRIGLAADEPENAAMVIRWKNDFGIVLLGVFGSETPVRDRIQDCRIMNNRWYGLVYLTFTAPEIRKSTLELNGLRPFRIARSVDTDKGLLSWLDEPTATAIPAPSKPISKRSG
jgi:hypothetical protein